MANLPIISNPPPSANTANAVNAASPSQKNGAQKNGAADAKPAEPFGTVLARQIDEANTPASNASAAAAGTDAKTKTTAVSAKIKIEQDKALAAADQLTLNNPNDPAGALVAMLQLPQDIKTPVIKDAAGDTAATGTASSRKAAAEQAASIIPNDASNALVAMLQPQPDIKTTASTHAAAGTAATRPAGTGPEGIGKAAENMRSADIGATQPKAQPNMASATSGKADAAFTAADKLALRAEANLGNSKSAELPSSLTSAAQNIAQPATSGVMANMLMNNKPADNPQSIAAPLGSNGWADEFSQKISWMSTQQNQVAELHLNPPDLGPLDVVLKISDNQATAMFTSPHSAVRDAIENALPKLREILADNGIMLGNTTVSDQNPRDNNSAMNQRGNSPAGRETSGIGNEPADSALSTLQLAPARRHNGLVDTFA